jgi:hypothetical protein
MRRRERRGQVWIGFRRAVVVVQSVIFYHPSFTDSSERVFTQRLILRGTFQRAAKALVPVRTRRSGGSGKRLRGKGMEPEPSTAIFYPLASDSMNLSLYGVALDSAIL